MIVGFKWSGDIFAEASEFDFCKASAISASIADALQKFLYFRNKHRKKITTTI